MERKFIVEQKALLSVLAAMQPICTKRTTIEATTSLLFQVGLKELIIKGTDLEISLQSSLQLKESDVMEPFSFLVSGRRLFDIVKELSGDIHCIFDDKELHVRCGSVKLSLHSKDAQEFPPFPERIENLMQLDAADMLAMLDKVAFVIPQNNANPALNGLFLEMSSSEFKMTTTDGYSLAQVSCKKYTLAESKKWLLPRRAVFELKKLLEAAAQPSLFLGTCGNQLVFSGSTYNFFSKLLADAFPTYAAILEKKGFVPAVLDRNEFIKTLRRSTCLLSGQFLATKFEFKESALNVSMHNKEVGKLEEEVALHDFKGDALELRFYAPYLLNGLQAFTDEKSTCYLKSSSRPIIFESQATDLQMTYLVMPVSPAAQ